MQPAKAKCTSKGDLSVIKALGVCCWVLLTHDVACIANIRTEVSASQLPDRVFYSISNLVMLL